MSGKQSLKLSTGNLFRELQKTRINNILTQKSAITAHHSCLFRTCGKQVRSFKGCQDLLSLTGLISSPCSLWTNFPSTLSESNWQPCKINHDAFQCTISLPYPICDQSNLSIHPGSAFSNYPLQSQTHTHTCAHCIGVLPLERCAFFWFISVFMRMARRPFCVGWKVLHYSCVGAGGRVMV